MKSAARFPKHASIRVLPRGALAALLLVFLFVAPAQPMAFAAERADSPLTGRVDLRFQRCRSGAPIPIVWELEWTGQAIAQGHLDYEVEDNNRVVASFRLPDLVLSTGKNVFNAMLPAMSVFSRSAPVTVRARFVSKNQSFEFEEQSLRVPNKFAQWFNVAVVSAGAGKPSKDESRFLDAFRWERLLAPNEAQDRSTTVSIDLDTTALPADPITLCNFDLVLLLPPALVEIRDNQADALKKWVAAGGSVCVIAGGGLSPRHAVFLNELLAEAAGRETFLVDARGNLAPGPEFAGEIISASRGLGRVVVLRQALYQALKPDAKEWLAAGAFLMKVRHRWIDRLAERLPAKSARDPFDIGPDQFLGTRWRARQRQAVQPPTGNRPSLQQSQAQKSPAQKSPGQQSPGQQSRGRQAPGQPTGRPGRAANPPQVPNMLPGGPNAQSFGPTFQLAPPSGSPNGRFQNSMSWRLQYDPTNAIRSELCPPPLESLAQLFQILMPRDVQMVPLHLIGIVLAAYVVAIGPLDYFLLGLLRMRRLTWIMFPLVTVAFAVFTLWLSRWYLGTNDSRQAIEIHDVVKGGIEARRTRVEMLFLSRERELGTEVQNGVFSHVGLGVTMDLRRMAVGTSSDSSRSDQSSFVGRFPNRYVVGQSIPQWTPIVNRFFWIDSKPVELQKTPGADPAASYDWDDPGDVTTPSGRQALAARIRRAFGDKACAVVYRSDNQAMATPLLNSFATLRNLGLSPDPSAMIMGIGEVVRELCCRKPEKLFALASQLAPNGSPELEDLAILDESAPRQSLLVIAVDSGPDLVLYRRLYFGGP